MGEDRSELLARIGKTLKDAADSTPESMNKRLGVLPYERLLAISEAAMSMASVNARAALDFVQMAPSVSRLVSTGDLRLWGEIGKRLATTSYDSAAAFLRDSEKTLTAVRPEFRSDVLKLINKQSALSANTAIETLKSAPSILASIEDHRYAAEILSIALELARHSVKHSNDLFVLSFSVLNAIKERSDQDADRIIARALNLTSAFAYRSGGTAAEFFAELPGAVGVSDTETLLKLFAYTEEYLDRSGGVALQYFKAASRVLGAAGAGAFERWTALARRVALQGNAASYHFMKASPQVVLDLANRGGRRGAEVISAVLEVVEEIAEHNTSAAIECFNASPQALRAASVGQFQKWARRGLESWSGNTRQTQAYYALESKSSQEALFAIEGGLTLDSVSHTLKLYVEALTGRTMNIAPLGSIPEETRVGDGKTIYLPSVVAEFEIQDENFRLFKVLAAHAAGQIEFDTYATDTAALVAALAETRQSFQRARATRPGPAPEAGGNRPASDVSFLQVLNEFPNPDLALKLFTTVENGRIDFLLRCAYRGIRRDLDFVRVRLVQRRPDIHDIPPELVPFELLFQAAICGGATAAARQAYPTAVGQIERILGDYVFQPEAGVGDSLTATRHIYDLFVERPLQSDAEDQTGTGDQGEGGDDSPEEAGSGLAESSEESTLSEDPLSFWSSGQSQETPASQEMLDQTGPKESAEQDVEKGDRIFYYDEWDRELGDYRTRWCRVLERGGVHASRGFVEMVRQRYGGIISSIRHQFQMLRPEDLKRIRREVDGDDFDLQAVVDYAIDKRSSGRIDDRLYTRKLRRERDVAVSFLLDMSSSTARTISRQPNTPYTQPGQRIIDIEKEGLVLMSEALESVGDTYSIQGFTSEGRRNVKFYVIKDFDERYSAEVERSIGGITYQNNTRLGAAIRHAAMRLTLQQAKTKLLIVLSDGRPYDHDYGDSRYAREDTMMALRQARIQGLTPFCITIDRDSEDQLRDMYGEVGYTIIDDVLSLPERLPRIYRRLTT